MATTQYAYEIKKSWNKKYYSFDQGHTWNTTKALALESANPEFLLVKTPVTNQSDFLARLRAEMAAAK